MVFQAHDKFPHMAGQTIWSNVGKPDEGPLFCAWDSCNWYKEGYRKVVLCKKLFLVDLISHSLAEYLQCNYRPITFYYLYYQLLLSLTRTTFKWISKASVDLNKNRSISSCNGAFKDPVNLIPLSFVFFWWVRAGKKVQPVNNLSIKLFAWKQFWFQPQERSWWISTIEGFQSRVRIILLATPALPPVTPSSVASSCEVKW